MPESRKSHISQDILKGIRRHIEPVDLCSQSQVVKHVQKLNQTEILMYQAYSRITRIQFIRLPMQGHNPCVWALKTCQNPQQR